MNAHDNLIHFENKSTFFTLAQKCFSLFKDNAENIHFYSYVPSTSMEKFIFYVNDGKLTDSWSLRRLTLCIHLKP